MAEMSHNAFSTSLSPFTCLEQRSGTWRYRSSHDSGETKGQCVTNRRMEKTESDSIAEPALDSLTPAIFM